MAIPPFGSPPESHKPRLVSSDPATVVNRQWIYNTTTDLLKLGMFDTWVTVSNFREIMITDESGGIVVDHLGNPILETNNMDYVRS
jgi:hypothetical protein